VFNAKTVKAGSLRLTAAVASVSLATLAFAGIGAAASSASAATKKVGISLIVKTETNPFFIAMENAAKAAANKQGVKLTLAAGKIDGDAASQIQAIENAIARGDKGILITPTDDTVNAAIAKARKAGIYVIALDTPPNPANAVDITFATDNFAAGKNIGAWTAAQLNGGNAVIALLDLFSDKVVSVDTARDQGFLTGMGINTVNKAINGDEAKTGKYTGGKGGTYTIVGSQPTNGDAADGRTAMETLLAKNGNINVVYAINEPAAYGGFQALQAAGKEKGVLVVGIDGGCAGVDQISKGSLGATSMQFPSKMATLGMQAIVTLVKTGKKPSVTKGLSFFNTGVQLVTDKPVKGLPSITSAAASKLCWGTK
jgi:fructose transport system substrate-binding protein